MIQAFHEPNLDRDRTTRLVEFFDGDLDAAYGFICNVWMPNAVRRLHELGAAVASRRSQTALYLADTIRDTARTIGAEVIALHAGHIERDVRQGDWTHADVRYFRLSADFRMLETHFCDAPIRTGDSTVSRA